MNLNPLVSSNRWAAFIKPRFPRLSSRVELILGFDIALQRKQQIVNLL